MSQVFLFESESLTKEERLRFVLDDQNNLWFDLHEKAPAQKSFYIPATKDCLQQFLQQQLAEGSGVTVAGNMKNAVENALKKHFLQTLSLLKKSGSIVVGLPKVQERMATKPLKALVLASDAGKDVSKRVHSWQIMLCHGVTGLDLENALGQHNVSLVGVEDKKEADCLLNVYSKYKALID